MPDRRSDAEVIRGGLDSLAWLVNNARHHDTDRWPDLVKAARGDRAAALVALDRLTGALDAALAAILEDKHHAERLQRALEQIRDDDASDVFTGRHASRAVRIATEALAAEVVQPEA